jgi:hypothetical protein
MVSELSNTGSRVSNSAWDIDVCRAYVLCYTVSVEADPPSKGPQMSKGLISSELILNPT